MALRRVNAVVVGAGAGGGVIAKELACAGLTVVLLERGKWQTAFDCRKDDLRNQRTTALGCGFGPDEERCPRVVVDGSGRERIVKPSNGSYSNNAACVGGGTLSYGAMAWRFMRQDFRMRSTYGAVEGSTLDDWPISYEDLEPYYEKAEWEIGVSGDDGPQHLQSSPQEAAAHAAASADSTEHDSARAAAKRMGLHPFRYSDVAQYRSVQRRGACMRCRWCVGFACEVNAKYGTHNTVIPKALATGNCELRTSAGVKEILTDARGRVTGVSYFDANDRLQRADRRLVIVCGDRQWSPRACC